MDKFSLANGGNILNKDIEDLSGPLKLDNVVILPYSYHRYFENPVMDYVYHAGGNTGTKTSRIKQVLGL
jgi:hypothetical protein